MDPVVALPLLGVCPICGVNAVFNPQGPGWRDSLACEGCAASGGSLPRDRAIAWALEVLRPDWRALSIHEFAPTGGALTRWLSRECPRYRYSHWDPQSPRGAVVRGVRNDDIHALTWADASIDIVLSLDVLEHITAPHLAIAEVSRVLRDDGIHLFTTPTYATAETVRTAEDLPTGEVHHHAEAEYHGSPNDPDGSLVYHRFGLDLLFNVREWSGRDCLVTRFCAPRIGVAGYFTEVYANGTLIRPTSSKGTWRHRRWRL